MCTSKPGKCAEQAAGRNLMGQLTHFACEYASLNECVYLSLCNSTYLSSEHACMWKVWWSKKLLATLHLLLVAFYCLAIILYQKVLLACILPKAKWRMVAGISPFIKSQRARRIPQESSPLLFHSYYRRGLQKTQLHWCFPFSAYSPSSSLPFLIICQEEHKISDCSGRQVEMAGRLEKCTLGKKPWLLYGYSKSNTILV